MQRLIIKNIGSIITGQLENPLLEAEAIYIEAGWIKKIGNLSEMPDPAGASIIDANGLTISPGLIDAHVHPLLCDYLPSFQAVGWIDSYVNGGVTSMISAGEIYVPGFPQTVSGVKSLAILAKQVWERYRPTGAKIHAGSVMLVQGLKSEDFAELAREGIKVVGEAGMSEVQDPEKIRELVQIARAHGFKTLVHSGGASNPSCASFTARDIFKIRPDVVCHLNGAPTPLSGEDVQQVIQEGDFYYDLTSSGNVKMLFNILNWTLEAGKLDKMLLGTNAPSMAGFSPLGHWMMMGALCVYTDLEPARAIALATGNVARCYGLEHGLVKEGYQADLLFCATAIGSARKDILETIKAGRIPSIAAVMVDGNIVLNRCRNTAPPSRQPVVVAGNC